MAKAKRVIKRYLYICKNCGEAAGHIKSDDGIYTFYCTESRCIIQKKAHFYNEAAEFIKSFKVIIK